MQSSSGKNHSEQVLNSFPKILPKVLNSYHKCWIPNLSYIQMYYHEKEWEVPTICSNPSPITVCLAPDSLKIFCWVGRGCLQQILHTAVMQATLMEDWWWSLEKVFIINQNYKENGSKVYGKWGQKLQNFPSWNKMNLDRLQTLHYHNTAKMQGD